MSALTQTLSVQDTGDASDNASGDAPKTASTTSSTSSTSGSAKDEGMDKQLIIAGCIVFVLAE